ncbi:MAG: hypothetical protein WD025_01600 [Bacteriovoracaceae bacterium]
MEELNAPIERRQIEVKESRNGKPIPIVNGIHLHSIYNPEKEAEAFASNYERAVKDKSTILVLGLGFAYHAREIAKLAERYHESYKILIYEPNLELIESFNQNIEFENPNVEVIHAAAPTDVFNDYEFVMFLTSKPAIIKHEPSYNLNKDFFKAFLTFKAPEKMESYRGLMTPEATRLFASKEGSIDQALGAVKKAGRLNESNDYAFFVLEAIIDSAKHSTKGLSK